jgi:catechol 2,3-dioxygenase-like lactoylglutathione lyase family enzyme
MEQQSPYAPTTDQLVVEVFARDIEASKRFYIDLGFELLEDRGDFVTLAWEGHKFFLDARPDQPPPTASPQANMRIMVPDVDRLWAHATELGAAVLAPIEDRSYGLRDFTILDPDGFGLRFGSWLGKDAGH